MKGSLHSKRFAASTPESRRQLQHQVSVYAASINRDRQLAEIQQRRETGERLLAAQPLPVKVDAFIEATSRLVDRLMADHKNPVLPDSLERL